MDCKEIITRIKDVRIEGGYTQARFAEILDMSYESYKKIEQGRVGISIEVIMLIEERLGIPASYILFGKKSDFEEIWPRVNLMDESDKFHLMMKLYIYFVRIKKASLPDSQEIESMEQMTEQLFEILRGKGVL